MEGPDLSASAEDDEEKIMSDSIEKNKTGSVSAGLAWKLLELCGTQGIQLLVSIVLARILSPDEYGTISLITIFITIANTIVTSGFATALIQKEDVTKDDFSSVFWVSLMLSVILYGVLFLIAPWVADFYEIPILSDLLRLTAVLVFPASIVSIQTAYLARRLQFRKLFFASLVAVIISGAIAVFLAARGAGVWAMSAQQILFYILLECVLFFIVEWKPHFVLAWDRLRELIRFGWKVLVAGLIDSIWSNVYGLIIGKKFSAAELGGYNRGEQFPKLIATNISSTIASVMLPAYSRMQNDITLLAKSLRQTVQYSAFLIFPLMAGLVAVAEPMVSVILTDKWLFCVPYLRILAVSYMLYPMDSANLQAINAIGRSDLFLKFEILKKISGILFLLAGLPFGIIAMLALRACCEIVCYLINASCSRKLIGYGIGTQVLDFLPSLLCAGIMCGAVYALSFTGLSGILLLILQVLLGIAVYAAASLLLNRKVALELLEFVKEKVRKHESC